MSNVVNFPSARRPTGNVRTAPPDGAVSPSSRYSYQKRNRNSPFRRLWYSTESAMVQVNKIEHRHTPEELEYIREGVAAARELADGLEQAAAAILDRKPDSVKEPKLPRRTNSEVMTRRREFKAAMRQRIRDVAASRDLTDEEIKPALTLKHEEIGNFCEQHGVRFEWLLEGRGRVFVTPGAAELAACVRTLPWAQQQTIEAMVVEMIDKRDQEEPPPNPPAA